MNKTYEYAGKEFYNKMTMRVYQIICEAPEGVTVREIGDHMPEKRRSINPAIMWLRQKRYIRDAGLSSDPRHGANAVRKVGVYEAV